MKKRTITTEAEVAAVVQADAWMMQVLHAAASLNLPDWWIGAGFLRNKVWDVIEGNTSAPTKDVDLVYFNAADTAPETDWAYDEQLQKTFPFAQWEVRNQARMHYVNGFDTYTSTADGIAHWVETATCVAVKLENDQLKFLFCYGTDDLFELVARPTTYFRHGKLLELFHTRVDTKQWRQKWPDLQVKIK